MRSLFFCLLLAIGLLPATAVYAATDTAAMLASPGQDALSGELLPDDDVLVDDVVLDGTVLFRVRGVSSLPANQRASRIKARIVALASDPSVDAGAGAFTSDGTRVVLTVDGQRLVELYHADAALEQIPLEVLAGAILERLASAIEEYREARSPKSLLTSTGMLLGLTVAAGLLLWATASLLGWVNRLIERAVKRRLDNIEKASHRVIDSAQLWGWFGGLMRGIRGLAMLAIVLTWVNLSLGLYPWTRPFAADIFHLVLNPLQKMGAGIVAAIPDITFLLILVLIVRFLLRATYTFFERIHYGWIRPANFDRDWALPTYRIVRILMIAFALVVAYPYIPGSDSEAFKGVSIFLGVIFSIGSSSFIANMIAGYSLTYRGAFREGDRVKIGEHTGEVVDVRALSTILRSLKNEEINIPNSEVLASAVVNYSAFQKDKGIILHTDVGIGYDTPWRQVEAMLLMAAKRTEGLESDPEPFVLQTSMGDFAVIYQLNAYCRDAGRMMPLYSALHANIQDVFNEFGVQIMSPNYEMDPDSPKLVPPEQWFAAPARQPGDEDTDAG